jgi:hypothetical protein
MATNPPLRLTRDDLASFLQNQRQIRAFENLFNTVEPLTPNAINEIIEAVGTAQATANSAQAQIQALKHIADLVETAPPPRQRKRTRYGQFYDTTVQTAAAANTAYAITFNTAETWNQGVFRRSPSTSEVAVDTEGLYNFQFSVQIDKTSGGSARFWIWFRLNGADVANSASEIQIQGNDAEIFSSANLFLDLKTGDYVQMMWAVSDTSVQIQYITSAAFRPAVPSIILTVSNIRGDT